VSPRSHLWHPRRRTDERQTNNERKPATCGRLLQEAQPRERGARSIFPHLHDKRAALVRAERDDQRARLASAAPRVNVRREGGVGVHCAARRRRPAPRDRGGAARRVARADATDLRAPARNGGVLRRRRAARAELAAAAERRCAGELPARDERALELKDLARSGVHDDSEWM